MTFEGRIAFRLEAQGSKSEGFYARLYTSEGEWLLYRSGCLAVNDRYFEPFDGLNVRIEGEPERRAGFILVQSIELKVEN